MISIQRKKGGNVGYLAPTIPYEGEWGVIFGASPSSGSWSAFSTCFIFSSGDNRGARGMHVLGRNGLAFGGLGRSVLGPLLIGPELF
jgi:hypothetical protein